MRKHDFAPYSNNNVKYVLWKGFYAGPSRYVLWAVLVTEMMSEAQAVINWNYALKRWTSDSQFRICSAKIVPLPHIGCGEHWLATLSLMANPITSFNIPPLMTPHHCEVLCEGRLYSSLFCHRKLISCLNAEAATWFFFSLRYCCCFVISLWGGMSDQKVQDCQPFSDLSTTADLSSSSERTKRQQK